jgi:hypothetical protein
VKRDTDEEFVTHAALVEHLRRFRQNGVVLFHPSSGEERTKRVHPKTGKVSALAGRVCSGWECGKASRIS